MVSTDSVKRALMGIGLLTVLAVGAVAALVAYVWWDSRNVADEEFSADTEFDREDATDDGGATADDEPAADADDAEVAAD